MYELNEPRESYKTRYMQEKAKKLRLEDKFQECSNELEKLQCKIISLNAEIYNLKQHAKRQRIKIASLEYDAKEDWLKQY